jgi:hypothetical protein
VAGSWPLGGQELVKAVSPGYLLELRGELAEGALERLASVLA